MSLSIIIPIYNEEDCIIPLVEEIIEALSELKKKYEIILVNDGSKDASGKILDQLSADNKNLKIIHFKRNYGQTAALMAGIKNSSGDVLIPMDGDLQNDPHDIPKMLDKLDEGYDVVSGWRKYRQDKRLSRIIPSTIANWIISKISNVDLHDYGCTLKAYRKSVIENVRLYGEMHRFIPIYSYWEGAKITELAVNHRSRKFGQSKYGLSRISRVVLDIVLIRFMHKALDRPIQFFGKIGLYSIFSSIITGIWACLLKLFMDISFVQTPLPLLTVFLTMSGIMFILLGLIAELQMRIYFESQDKLPYTIKEKHNFSE